MESKGGDQHDWIFDVVLTVLEGEAFDCAVMTFVDEHCEAFDSIDEENKLEFTDLHSAFIEHVEALIIAECTDLGITPELFYEACEVSRQSRDVNIAVFERLVAIDDFPTFKKIMVKRNIELQLEALRTFRHQKSLTEGSGEESDHWRALDEGGVTGSSPRPGSGGLNALLSDAYLEMDLLHKQERVEQDDLALAMALSLASVEEEKTPEAARRTSFLLHSLAESKWEESDRASPEPAKRYESEVRGERLRLHAEEDKEEELEEQEREPAREVVAEITEHRRRLSFQAHAALDSRAEEDEQRHVVESDAKASARTDRRTARTAKEVKAKEPLPTPTKIGRAFLQPLPSIGSPKEFPAVERLTQEVEGSLDRNKRDLAVQQEVDGELKNRLDEAEVARRASHMREQQKAIVAQKKKEREAKLAATKSKVQDSVAEEKDTGAKHSDEAKDSDADRRRAIMSMALASRLKEELQDADVSQSNLRENLLTDLNRKLQKVEQLRQRNEQRERTLAGYMDHRQNR